MRSAGDPPNGLGGYLHFLKGIEISHAEPDRTFREGPQGLVGDGGTVKSGSDQDIVVGAQDVSGFGRVDLLLHQFQIDRPTPAVVVPVARGEEAVKGEGKGGGLALGIQWAVDGNPCHIMEGRKEDPG